jgi:hypothetical protein
MYKIEDLDLKILEELSNDASISVHFKKIKIMHGSLQQNKETIKRLLENDDLDE